MSSQIEAQERRQFWEFAPNGFADRAEGRQGMPHQVAVGPANSSAAGAAGYDAETFSFVNSKA